MASTYSDRLKIELIGDGEQSGSWGSTTNNNLSQSLEQAISGVLPITTNGSSTLTLTTGSGHRHKLKTNLDKPRLYFTVLTKIVLLHFLM